MSVDTWGEPVSSSAESSVAAWNQAWESAMHFTGDPFDVLANANADDHEFSLGSVFCGVYRVLGGSPFDATDLLADIERAQARAQNTRERGHVEALLQLTQGNFTQSAETWDGLAADSSDFAAVRFAHDIYLHVGDVARRLRSSQAALDRWDVNAPEWSFIAGQHAFSLEEAGSYDEAEALGYRALEVDPLDLWALHALAHVYEMREDSNTAIELLRGRQQTWAEQDALAVHIWWHLALRLIATRQFDAVLEIHDSLVPVATTPFRLCDQASLLWRLELAGVGVGDRWDGLADAFSVRPERHSAGFLDLHAALVFTRRPSHPGANVFFAGLESSHRDGNSENDEIFATVVRPLVEGIRAGETHAAAAVGSLDAIDDQLHRIGGSIAQRDIVGLTRDNFERIAVEAS